MTTALITGLGGFVASHLAELLLKTTDWQIVGTMRWSEPLDNLEDLAEEINAGGRVRVAYTDLTDANSLRNLVASTGPDYVFHLAAQSYPQTSFTAPAETIQANTVGTLNLLEAVRLEARGAWVQVCSSSEVYGKVAPENIPITEDCPFHPASPYAISKAGTDMLGRYYAEAHGLRTVITRMFTHSVSRWTPVIIRDRKSGLLDIKYISELRQAGKRGGYFSGRFLDDGTQIWDFSRNDLDVWNDGVWTPIRSLSCHPIRNHRMLEVTTRAGSVDVTDNHSIIAADGTEAVAGDLQRGDPLKSTTLPSINVTEVHEELAWLYGFFVAEGCLTHGKIQIDNKKECLLKKCQDALLRHLGAASYFCEGANGVMRLTIRKPGGFKQLFEGCYASDKNKRIPKLILNASRRAKIAFLRGYNEGDGRTSRGKLKSEFLDFKTKSPILAAGLFMLTEECLKVRCRMSIEHRGDRRYYCVRPLTQTGSKRGVHLRRPPDEVVGIHELEYSGEVWDFETENHWFHAGVGNLVVHNTGPRRGDVFAESSFAKQIAMIEAGKLPPVIKVGNLDSLRTVADVRDAVRAYRKALTVNPEPGAVYNIGGDKTVTIGELLDDLRLLSGVEAEIEVDQSRLRPIDADNQVPDCSKFKAVTGWEPLIPYEQTISDLFRYWRVRVGRSVVLQR